MSSHPPQKPILLVALGGNALIKKGQAGTIEEQFANLQVPVAQIAALSSDYRIIITHGNGPQVGNLLLQQEQCRVVPRMPLEILVAQTEGQIGYMIESSLDEELMAIGIEYRPLITLITYVVVDAADPGFSQPTKPIGPVIADDAIARCGYPVVKTAKGYRRVVASPKPLTIIEKREIKQLIDLDFIVICCGGGGIPVVRDGRGFHGVDAVIDKDLASARLAAEIGADLFIIVTDVPGAMLHYETPEQTLLGRITAREAQAHIDAGHFTAGSMGPKMEACCQFIRSGGRRAVITGLETLAAAVADDGVGTQITGA
jgi:carbamate kinase